MKKSVAQAFVDSHRDEGAAELFGITELCREFGITLRALRFYEDKGLLSPRRINGARVYTRRDRARLSLILRPFPLVLDLGTPFQAFGDTVCAQRGERHVHSLQDLQTSDSGKSQDRFEVLPLKPSTYDLIVSGMMFHRINDLPGLLVQARAALKPDGLLMAVFPGGETLTELRQSLLQAESELTGGASMRVAPFIDVRSAGQLLQRAGFALPVVDSDNICVRYESMFDLIKDLRGFGASAAMLKRAHAPSSRTLFTRAAQIYAERFSDADGRIRASFEMIWISGWAAHESQQKPLKPGSAKAKLADALKDISKNEDEE